MTTVHFVALWVHVSVCIFLTGASFLLILAGKPIDTITSHWESRVLNVCRWLFSIAIVSGVFWFAFRTAIFEGRTEAAYEFEALIKSMVGTWSGQIWMIRHGLLIVATCFIWIPINVQKYADWLAARIVVFLLAGFVLILVSASSHIAALPASPWLQGIDMLHMLGGGVWLGALPPLAYLLIISNPTSYKFTLRAMQRFSRVAISAVVIIASTGVIAAWLLLENLAGLIGTTHGQLLLVKIAILIPVLLLAKKVRRSLFSSKVIEKSDPIIIRRMAYYIVIEATLVFILLSFAVMMTLSVPAIHSSPSWPLPIRFSWDKFEYVAFSQFTISTTIVILFLLSFLILLIARRTINKLRFYGMTTGVVSLVTAIIITVSPQFITTAYSTSYERPQASYHTRSITIGKDIFRQYCASCSESYIDSNKARWLTPGELYWFISNGFPAEAKLSNFGYSLKEIDRWHVVNYMRASIRASQSHIIGPEIDFENPWLIAPDFTISVGPLTPMSLRDYRSRKMVLVVLYNLPESRDRMRTLAIRYGTLISNGVEIVAVSRQHLENPIASLGDRPTIVFPILTQGNEEIENTYGMFVSGTSHAEILIDRQGYIRAIWHDGDIDVVNARAVQRQVERLNKEKIPPLPDDHIH